MSLIIAKNKVSYEDLMGVQTPDPTDSFMPIPHYLLVDLTKAAILAAGLTIVEEEFALSRGGLNFFGGFAVTGKGLDSADRQVVIGIRNSNCKEFAAAICIGNRMLVCENLCFASDIRLARRHTVRIKEDLPRIIADAVGRVISHWNDMERRIESYKATEISDAQAADLAVRLADCKAIPSRDIHAVIKEFRKPSHVEFEGRSLWSLYNSVTENLKGGDFSKLPFRTMTCQSILDAVAGHIPHLEVQEIVAKGCEDASPASGTDLRE